MNTPHNSGFTLIELIVAIVLSAIAMAAVLPLLDQVFLKNYEPRVQLHEGFSLQSAMEDLVAWHTNSLTELQAHVGGEGSDYHGSTVLENRFVLFSGGVESQGGSTLLKITLQNNLGETATRLFTEPL